MFGNSLSYCYTLGGKYAYLVNEKCKAGGTDVLRSWDNKQEEGFELGFLCFPLTMHSW